MKMHFQARRYMTPILSWMSITGLAFILMCICGCSRDGENATTNNETPIIEVSDEASFKEVSAQEKLVIPFKLDYTYDISFPPGTVGIPMEGAWDGSSKFDPPVHPMGTISDLTYDGNAIELINSEIQQGFLKTKEFGDIEVLLLGTGPRGGGLEFRATIKQITKMKNNVGLKSDRGIKPAPEDSSSYEAQGTTYYAKGQYDRAIISFSKIIGMKPKDGDGYLGRGMAYSKNGSYDLAIKDFTKVIELDPTNKYAYKFRSDCYFEKGQPDLAIQDYNKVIELDPKELHRLESAIEKR